MIILLGFKNYRLWTLEEKLNAAKEMYKTLFSFSLNTTKGLSQTHLETPSEFAQNVNKTNKSHKIIVVKHLR